MKDVRERVSHINEVSSKDELVADSVFFYRQKNSLAFQNITLVFAVAAVSIFLAASFSKADTSWAADITVDTIFSFANQDRSGQGLPALKNNTKLNQAAQNKAQDMISNNYFAHTSPQGTTPWRWIDKEKYDYNYAGENLAMDFTAAEKMNDAWMASPTHRANILNPKYKDIGIGIAQGNIDGHGTTVVVQMFGSGDKSQAAASELEENSTGKINNSSSGQQNIPELPAGTDGKILFNPFSPLITFPMDGSIIRNTRINIMGRSQPNNMIAIYEKDNLLGKTTASSDGWFSLSSNDFDPGNHNLVAKSVVAQKSGLSSREISFAVDNEKPEIQYELLNNTLSSNGAYFLKVSLSKPNCSVRFDDKTIAAGNSRFLILAAPENMLSSMIKAEDEAGNTASKEANFSNYFPGAGAGDIIDKLAGVLSGNSQMAASGQQAIEKNLNLAMAKK